MVNCQKNKKYGDHFNKKGKKLFDLIQAKTFRFQ